MMGRVHPDSRDKIPWAGCCREASKACAPGTRQCGQDFPQWRGNLGIGPPYGRIIQNIFPGSGHSGSRPRILVQFVGQAHPFAQGKDNIPSRSRRKLQGETQAGPIHGMAADETTGQPFAGTTWRGHEGVAGFSGLRSETNNSPSALAGRNKRKGRRPGLFRENVQIPSSGAYHLAYPGLGKGRVLFPGRAPGKKLASIAARSGNDRKNDKPPPSRPAGFPRPRACFLHLMHSVVTGRAFRRGTLISSPQSSHTPKEPSSMR